jgi:glycosyltransferase involved in cell wall biosynthesis
MASRSLKIIFVTPTLELHGGNIVMLKHAHYLLSQGHEIIILTTNKPVELEIDPSIRIITYKKFPIKWVDFFSFQLVYLYSVLRCIEEADYIIPIYGPLIVHVIYAKRRLGLRGLVVPLFQDSLTTLWVGPYIRLLLHTNYVKAGTYQFIAISTSVAEGYKRLSGKDATLIPNGIEGERFYPRSIPKEEYVLFVGRPNRPKGFPVFQASLQVIREQFPEINAKVIGPNVVPATVGRVEYICYMDREQLASLYCKAVVYVNASYAESFALPPLEAMASGTAVVMTATGGEREYAVNRKNCSIVPVGDHRQLAVAVIELLKNPKRRKRYEAEGIITAKQYDWARSTRKFQEFLENVQVEA